MMSYQPSSLVRALPLVVAVGVGTAMAVPAHGTGGRGDPTPALASTTAIVTAEARQGVQVFPSGLAGAWGIGFDTAAGNLVWVSDPSATGGTHRNLEYSTDGTSYMTPTGNWVDLAATGLTFLADMAFDTLTGKFWQAGSGGGDCIHEFDPDPDVMAFTGVTICPSAGIPIRGLAHDPLTNTFYAGTWIMGCKCYQFDAQGNTVGGPWVHDYGVSGLAFDPASGRLVALVNGENPVDIVVFDTTDASLPVLFSLPSGMGQFEQAGLAMDQAGRLWAVNQGTDEVVVLPALDDIVVFFDNFESGDTLAWTVEVP